jgi:hypothetical protein
LRSRTIAASLLVLIGLTVTACSSADGQAQSPFWDGTEDAQGAAVLVGPSTRTTEELLQLAEGIALVRVNSIQSENPQATLVSIVAEDTNDQWQIDRAEQIVSDVPSSTTYSATVESWIKGTGQKEILIEAFGGFDSKGDSHFADGWFLLEPGRTYLLSLYTESGDGVGNFYYMSARTSFDLTDGVKVLNHPSTRDIEHFEDMSVDDFVSYVRELTTDGAVKSY